MPRSYTKYESIRKLMESDVACVEQYARFLWIVDEDGHPLAMLSREKAPLNIIAVIGPAVFEGHPIGVALLLEVGLGRARPYHPAFVTGGLPSGKSSIVKRRNYGLLEERRFEVLQPFLLDTIVKHAREVVSEWKNKEWHIPSPRSKIVRKEYEKKSVSTKLKETWHVRGARISVSLHDEALTRILLGCDVARLKNGIHESARLLNRCLGKYRNADYPDSCLRRYSRANASGLRLLVESFGPREGKKYGRLRPHHVAYMYTHRLIPPERQLFFERCAEFFSLVDVERTRFFQKLKYKERNLPKGIDVWIPPERRAQADYLVCEIIPHEEKEDVYD